MMDFVRGISILLLFACCHAFSQSSPEAGSEDELIIRDLQLLERFPASYSFTVRPVLAFTSDTIRKIDQVFLQNISNRSLIKNRYFSFGLMPVAYSMQWNSNSPWGRNNGSFLLKDGYQMIFNAGFEFNSKLIDFRIYPDLFMPGKESTGDSSAVLLFGRNSMIRLKAGNLFAISAGTESLWWGPSVFNSMMMSNNAPGFPHLSFHTLKPLSIPFFGTLEFQLVAASLKSARLFPMENFNLEPIIDVLPGYLKNERYYNGLNFSFQPAFLPGLTVGINRIIQYYTYDRDIQGNLFQTYLPVVTPVFKNKAGGVSEDARNRDQLINIFTRYLFKEYQFEIYGEFGWNDYKFNIRDLTLNPDHAAAYNLGLRKVVKYADDGFFTIEGELTQMAPTNSDIARPAGNWYVHAPVREGYTNYGQIMGGGVGPGDNTSTVRVSRTTNRLKQSIILERYQHDPQFQSVKWTDWMLGLRHQQHWKSLTFAGGIDVVRRNNYNFSAETRYNFQPNLKVLYHWK